MPFEDGVLKFPKSIYSTHLVDDHDNNYLNDFFNLSH